MPPQLRKNTKYAVSQAIWRATQARLQAEVDCHMAGGGLGAAELSRLDLARADWALIANRDHHHFIAAALLFTDGVIVQHRWRIPYAAGDASRAELYRQRVKQVGIDKGSLIRYPPGARAGSGRRSGGHGSSPSASQPDIGRAFKRHVRSAGTSSSAP